MARFQDPRFQDRLRPARQSASPPAQTADAVFEVVRGTLTAGHGDRVLVRRAPLAAVRRGQAVLLAGTLAEMWPEMAARSPDGAAGARPPSVRSPGTSAAPAAVRRSAEEPFRMVKRATAVPGDPIPRDVPSLRQVPGHVVPEGLLVVLGDNAEESRDSRHFGYAPSEWLVGVVVRRIAAG